MRHLRVTAAKGLLGLADLLETAALHLLPEPTTPVAAMDTFTTRNGDLGSADTGGSWKGTGDSSDFIVGDQ